jgi:hypothetical protein
MLFVTHFQMCPIDPFPLEIDNACLSVLILREGQNLNWRAGVTEVLQIHRSHRPIGTKPASLNGLRFGKPLPIRRFSFSSSPYRFDTLTATEAHTDTRKHAKEQKEKGPLQLACHRHDSNRLTICCAFVAFALG